MGNTSNMYVDLLDLALEAVNRSKKAGSTTYDTVNEVTQDPRLANQTAARVIAEQLGAGGAFKSLTNAGFAAASDVLALFFQLISAFRHEETHTFDSTAVEVVNEFLGTELDPSVMASGKGGDETIQKANAIGGAVLDRLEKEFTGGNAATPESGAAAARTFAGYGINFAIQNALVSLLGACIPETRLDDLRELGVEVAGNLGLGALISMALSPLIENTISKPYRRQLNAKYQQDLLGIAELGRAHLRGTMDGDTVKQLMREWGVSDVQIDELISQLQPRLGSAEWNVLTALGLAPEDQTQLQDVGRGMPAELVKLKQTYESFHRMQRPRQRALQAVLSEIAKGFLIPGDLYKVMDDMGVPADEQKVWAVAAGYVGESNRKRLSQADLLFLYEAAQVTDQDVMDWAKSEGYSLDDQFKIVTLFQLKLVEASNKKTGGTVVKAAHLHNEHVAFVTDEISGLWGRNPTKAELDYWVKLLDGGDRTKSDFKTELKGLDTTGPAIPG